MLGRSRAPRPFRPLRTRRRAFEPDPGLSARPTRKALPASYARLDALPLLSAQFVRSSGLPEKARPFGLIKRSTQAQVDLD
jgi:hypothetical protein